MVWLFGGGGGSGKAAGGVGLIILPHYAPIAQKS